MRATAAAAVGPGGEGEGGVMDWVEIQIVNKRRKNRRQSPNILNKALTKEY